MALPQEAATIIQQMEDNERKIAALKAENKTLKKQYGAIVRKQRLESLGINIDDLVKS